MVDCTQVTVGIEELNRQIRTPDAGFSTVRCRSRTSCVLAYLIHEGTTKHNLLYVQEITFYFSRFKKRLSRSTPYYGPRSRQFELIYSMHTKIV